MTLATTLFLCVACSATPADLSWQASQNSASQNQTSQKQTSEHSGNGETGARNPAASGQQKPKTSERGRHNKKAVPRAVVECPPASSGGSPTSANGANASVSPGTSASNQAGGNQHPGNQPPSNETSSSQSSSNQNSVNPPPAKAAANKAPSGNASGNCPPSKTVIRDGGITEQPIQLVGGKDAGQASQQRSTTDELLGSTEENLKKVAGHQLSSSQQDMVTQIQLFVEQSKAAVSTGDMDRGHNLALKAHLLSDELVKP